MSADGSSTEEGGGARRIGALDHPDPRALKVRVVGMDVRQELFIARVRAQTELAILGLKSLTLVNGASAVSLLTFIGNARLSPSQQSQLAWAMVAFAVGVGLALAATIVGYWAAQREAWANHPDDPRESLESQIPRGIAIGFAIFALVAFGSGVWWAAGAFITRHSLP